MRGSRRGYEFWVIRLLYTIKNTSICCLVLARVDLWPFESPLILSHRPDMLVNVKVVRFERIQTYTTHTHYVFVVKPGALVRGIYIYGIPDQIKVFNHEFLDVAR